MRRTLLTTSLLSLSLLTACSGQQAGLPYSPKFQLAQLDAPAAIAVMPAEGQKPTAKGTETLVVKISQFLSKFRRVLAVPAVVNKVIITVIAADGTVYTEIIDLAALTAGQTSVTFNGLVPGDATIVIEAYDASNQVIGSSRDTARVTPGVVAQKDMSLPVGNAPVLAGSGGSGGGASAPSITPSPGGLTTQVGLMGGPSLMPLTSRVKIAGSDQRFAFSSNAGTYWTVLNHSVAPKVVEVDAAGTTLNARTVDTSNTPIDRLAIDHAQHFWMVSNGFAVFRVTPTGSVLWRKDYFDFPSDSRYGELTAEIVIDDANHAWLPFDDRLLRLSPDGNLVVGVELNEPLDMLVRDPNSGVLWGAPRRGNWILQVTPDGVATRFTFVSQGASNGVLMDVDTAGHVWLPRQDAGEVLELAPDGTVAARYQVPGVQGVFCDKAGNPWVFDETGVYRLGPDGRPGDGYAIKNVDYAAISSPTDTVWLLRGAALYALPD